MVEKLDMRTKDIVAENVEKIAALFPDCVTESLKDGKLVKSIDFDALRQELSDHVVGGGERYQFTWPGKSKAKLLANTPINLTLRPYPDESVDFENTKNLYIEGDNLDVLKLLRETYFGKIKLIYIDPPYNTGNDFVYKDDFKIDAKGYAEISGDFDEGGNRLEINLSSNGRFHTDWLNMIYPRLKLARDLMSQDGCIFISIDDTEASNLRKICDNIFGEANFVAQIVWKRKRGRDNSARWFSKSHEYLVLYAKDKSNFHTNYLELDEETKKAYKNPDKDPRGPYRILGCWARGTQGGVKYDYLSNSGQYFSERLWLMSKNSLKKLDDDGKLVIRGDNIYRKMFISENRGKIPETLWTDVSNAANASDEIKKLFKGIVFDTPKPIPYIIEMLKIVSGKNYTVLDFYSGSATTAHAVMQMNSEDGGNRKFIMVQLPEDVSNNSEAKKMGYKTICDIGKERIRRAGKLVKSATVQQTLEGKVKVDTGFRVLKTDSSNMKDVYYSPDEMFQSGLDSMMSNVKEDRTSMDLLFQSMLDLGIELSASISLSKIGNTEIYDVDGGYLIACFDTDVTEEIVTEIAKRKPVFAVMRDSSMDSDSTATNFEQIFRSYSPMTKRKVI